MIRRSKLALAALFVFFSAVVTPAIAQENPTDKWVVPGSVLESGKKKSDSTVKIKSGPNLIAAVTKTKTHISIRLSDGKQKFGSNTFQIQNGENIYLRPRLSVTVPLTSVAAVTKQEPLRVLAFSHVKDKFEITLVANPDSKIPDVVFTKK